MRGIPETQIPAAGLTKLVDEIGGEADCLPGFKSMTRKNTAIYGIVIILSYKFSISQRKNSQSKIYPNKACCNPSGLFFFLSTTFCLTSILNGYELLLGIIPLGRYYQSVSESPV